ncbi:MULTISPECIES: 2Fe-2S iron-sulfur cluster-binding protein [unclassified Marinobacter]|uniref:2Fe-2S iron-sulfur cluster-binding protein n=1 Tax=unclassified Marinobacter TaxID=83889 RepID=UPI001927C949|nr:MULTISPECIES: pyridoxamine 5'-phosphate oxidase family protein [unclassified Marinobacter]MBL3827113.1 pyridoxamine 5'-phosphate oxidase family protein [Marinobacter sp. MC3]MBL3895662.1 pyridoxamine 5'-phosphate oxidase family protein [Marinobacter sp. MW3]
MKKTPDVFHIGERAVQARADVPDTWLKQTESFVRTEMPQQHRDFFESLPLLFLALLDRNGRPWCVPAFGAPGFVVSPAPDLLELRRTPVLSNEFGLDRSTDASVGIVGIDLNSRRRNRVNGRVQHTSDGAMTIQVDQSFGNCPQYIQTRAMAAAWQEAKPASRRQTTLHDPEVRRMVEAADTFFIASRAAGSLDGGSAGVDASHRGGRPGFLGINDDGSLSFPDFSGNRFFNTLGNIESDGRVSLFIPDFETGDAVLLTGRGTIDWDSARVGSFDGAERIVDVVPEEIWHVTSALPVAASAPEPWPGLDNTGTWKEARLAALKIGGYRRFQIASKRKESNSITSFYLTPADGGPIESHVAGQFLPIRIRKDDDAILRSYTISQGPNGQDYRLSIKREPKGLASRILHDELESGDILEVGSPSGNFVLDEGTQPIVMLSGGVGITPMMAMLDAQMAALRGGAPRREVYFIHATQNSASQAFRAELAGLASQYDWLHLFTAYSAPLKDDLLGDTHRIEARLSVDILSRLLPFGGYQFYLCGPEMFMRSLYSGLREIGVDRSHIHYEFFGAGELGESEELTPTVVLPERANITFGRSGVQAEWTHQSGTLLETAEASGLKPDYNCRSGKCGACATRLTSGVVHYQRSPVITPGKGEVLTCCAVPMSEDVQIDI